MLNDQLMDAVHKSKNNILFKFIVRTSKHCKSNLADDLIYLGDLKESWVLGTIWAWNNYVSTIFME